jgi:hypothetical protein
VTMSSHRLPADDQPIRLAVPDPLPGVRMSLPSTVRLLSPGKLAWQRDGGEWVTGPPARGCLNEFAQLADATDDRIARFAGRWGVLGFCEHGLPGVHGRCGPEVFEVDDYHARPSTGWFVEDTNRWRQVARGVAGFLAMASTLYARRTPTGAMFEAVTELVQLGNTELSAANLIEHHRRVGDKWPDLGPFDHTWLARSLTIVMARAGVVPEFSWDEHHRRFSLGLALGGPAIRTVHGWRQLAPSAWTESKGDWDPFGFDWPRGSLYPVLIIQIAAAIGSQRLTACSECARPFDWQGRYERLPQSGRGTYCTAWCRDEARRRQKASWKRTRPKPSREEGLRHE